MLLRLTQEDVGAEVQALADYRQDLVARHVAQVRHPAVRSVTTWLCATTWEGC
jgi:hypothetical protein